jgi:two-component system OmpR family response regulator
MAKNEKKVRIFSALEVANICGVVNQTAINWIKNGYLKAFTTPGGQYRVYAEDLLEFLQERNMRVPEELLRIVQEEPTPKSLLIVDDDTDLNNLLKEYFVRKLQDFKVYQAFDGFEAGRLLMEHKPRVVILDIDLPGIDGFKLCSKIKEDPALGNPQILAITGLDDSDVEARIMREGANAFFRKPLDFDKLLEMLER